jgi:hypothetical protein
MGKKWMEVRVKTASAAHIGCMHLYLVGRCVCGGGGAACLCRLAARSRTAGRLLAGNSHNQVSWVGAGASLCVRVAGWALQGVVCVCCMQSVQLQYHAARILWPMLCQSQHTWQMPRLPSTATEVLQKVRDLKNTAILFRVRAVRVDLRPEFFSTSAVRARAAICPFPLSFALVEPFPNTLRVH